MEHYEEVLKLLHDKFDWNLTDSLTTTGKKLVADTIKALKIAENNHALQLQQGGVSGSFPNQCSCSFNHGTNCFTGNCTACGLRKDNYVKQEKSYSEKDMIESAKYGYEYHATTSFPEKNFEDNCKNNFLQHLFAKFGKNYR